MAKKLANSKVYDGLRADLEAHFEALIAKADKENVRKKLRNVHRTCAHIVDTAAGALSVMLVVKTYATICDGKIGESTIRNKVGGSNPYQALYRRWEVFAAAKVAATKPRQAIDAGILGDHEIMDIEDPKLRHQVTLMVHHNRTLHSELNILKNDLSNVPLRIDGLFRSDRSDLVLSDDEVEAVRDFVDARKMNAKNLQRTKDHGVRLKDGRPIADPGFVSALEKIVKSYERQ
jgi:hypothetical protein